MAGKVKHAYDLYCDMHLFPVADAEQSLRLKALPLSQETNSQSSVLGRNCGKLR